MIQDSGLGCLGMVVITAIRVCVIGVCNSTLLRLDLWVHTFQLQIFSPAVCVHLNVQSVRVELSACGGVILNSPYLHSLHSSKQDVKEPL